MNPTQLDLEGSCWSAAYLLAHCERYRVDSVDGKLGYVERVVMTSGDEQPLALRVRVGGEGGALTVGVEDVLELHPREERIVVWAQRGRRVSAP